MSALSENQELYNYLQQNYSTTQYRFERLFRHSFPYKKLNSMVEVPNLLLVNRLCNLEKLQKSPMMNWHN